MRYFPQQLTIDWIKASYERDNLSPTELIEEIIKRAKEMKHKNIWIVEPSMDVIKPYIDNLENISKDSPLWGVPFAIKDNIDLNGVMTTAACKEYGYMATEDAVVVHRLIEAGAVPVGKTNLDQFATGLVGTRSPYGEVHNAYDETMISGGSSSGSAVSVALGMAAFSLGTDTAGSGRVPASLNSIIGYKPPLGAWSTRGVVPACASLDCVSVFGVTLKEINTVNNVLREYDDECKWSRKYQNIVTKLPKRVCIPKDGIEFYGKYASKYQEGYEIACTRIKNMGIEVVEIDYTMFKKAAAILYEGPWIAERWKDLGAFVTANPEDVFSVTKEILESSNKAENTATRLFDAIHELQGYKQETSKILQDTILMLPTSGGTFTREEVDRDPIKTNSKMGLYTNHCNLLDLCAVAVPTKKGDKDIPVGVTFFALKEEEGMILELARVFLEAEPMKVAVCGLHRKGQKLESELIELGGKYIETTTTAPLYKLYKLDTTPTKPGMYRETEHKGRTDTNAIKVDIYEIPVTRFGEFMAKVKSPLCMGNILLSNNEEVVGFMCEEYAVSSGEDITNIGEFIG